ncbi:glycosylated lysosomal membrane protein A-like [Epargyreus clarus]|uniref:glycosylated lysosomal membrane protein A-like n=1 Tax=Epargyreus clarus TaxID=520877 RepID=UPI003C2AB522
MWSGLYNNTSHQQFQLMSSETRWEELPRLFLSLRSTLVDVGLVGLTPFCEYEAARFAVRYVVVSQDCATGKLEYMAHKKIDDEYTPGVFEMIELLTPSSNWNASGGYLQYRPVAYTARKRSVGSSVQASMHIYNKASIPSESLAKRYFGNFEPGALLVQEAVASFGDRGDGYYRQTNYTAWTLTMGYGLPGTEKTSSFMTAALVLGLVVSFAVLVVLTFVSEWLVAARARRNSPASRAPGLQYHTELGTANAAEGRWGRSDGAVLLQSVDLWAIQPGSRKMADTNRTNKSMQIKNLD